MNKNAHRLFFFSLYSRRLSLPLVLVNGEINLYKLMAGNEPCVAIFFPDYTENSRV